MHNKEPKYLEVLQLLYDSRPASVHYTKIEPILYSAEVRDKYKGSRGKKSVIDGMVCRYMGKICRKDFCQAQYSSNKNYSYFVGYYIRPKGIELLKNKGIIKNV